MARLELSKYLPDDIVLEIQSKLLPNKTFIYNFLQELLNKLHNTQKMHYCTICSGTLCIHLLVNILTYILKIKERYT
jgi:hypothetical protein